MDGFEPSLVESPRILALRTSTAQEQSDLLSIELEALTHEIDELNWTACVAPWVPTESGVECPAISFDLTSGSANLSASLDLDTALIPEDYQDFVTTLYVMATPEGDELPPAVLSVDLASEPNNPPLEGLSLDGVSPEAWSPGPDGTIEVAPIWADPSGAQGTTTSFYTTRGAFDPWRVVDGGSSVLTLEEGDEPVTLYVVSRYLGEGASWVQLEVSP